MKQSRAFQPIHAVGLVIAACLIGVMIWLVGTPSSKKAETEQPVESNSGQSAMPETSLSPSLVASPDPEELRSAKREIRRVVKSFVPVYYSRDERLFAGSVDQRMVRFVIGIEPYVTPSFIRGYVTPLNNPVDEQIVGRGGSVRSQATDFSGHMDDSETVIRLGVRRIVVMDGVVIQRAQSFISLSLVYRDQFWKIDTVSEG